MPIATGFENNFDITSTAFTTTQGVPYDLGSVMHYGARAFSRNRQPTIVPVDPSVSLNSLGQRNGLSDSDVQHVNSLYCGGACECSVLGTGVAKLPSLTCESDHSLHSTLCKIYMQCYTGRVICMVSKTEVAIPCQA